MATSVPDSPPPSPQDKVLALLRHIDTHLQNAVTLLACDAGQSPLPRHADDATPIQHAVVADHVRRLRDAMAHFLEQRRIAVPTPEVCATRTAMRQLLECERRVAELSPAPLGIGNTWGPEGERQLNALIAELRSGIGVMLTTLAAERVAPAFHAPDTAEHTDLLSRILRIATCQGLTVLQNRAEQLTEYEDNAVLHVGLLGRTNAGKSSLLNALLGTTALPVGAIPMTVAPVRIAYGQHAQATAILADMRNETFEPWRLAEFVSTRANAGNRRHVRHLQLTLPAALLREGLVLIDMPGIDTVQDEIAWQRELPDVDLAIVVIDAESGLAPIDVRLMTYAQRCGSDVVVLLNKADLLPLEARWEVLGFTQHRIREQTGRNVDVYLASAASQTELGKRWIDAVLLPAVAAHRQRHAQVCERKVRALRDEVIAELQYRASVLAAAGTPQALCASHTEALALLDGALRELETPPPRPDVASLADTAVREAAWNIAGIWRRDATAPLDPAPLLLASQRSRARAMRLGCELWCDTLRTAVAKAIDRASEMLHTPPHRSAMPVLRACPDTAVFAPVLTESELRKTLSRRPAFWPVHRTVRRIMREARACEATEAALHDYAFHLEQWCGEVTRCLRATLSQERERLLGAHAATPVTRYASLRRDIAELEATVAAPSLLHPGESPDDGEQPA